MLSDYYALTESILKDNVLMRTLIILSITQIRRKNSSLRSLRLDGFVIYRIYLLNMNEALKEVGIDNVDILRQIGAENAIVRLKKADIGATEAFIGDFGYFIENRN